MSFLITDSDARYINAESVELKKELPIGIYKTQFSQMIGTYFEKTNISTSHGKIYGESDDIASHIVTRFKNNKSEKNIGVLLSGGKGLGKSLTAKLVIEKLKDTNPIIIVNDYTKDLPDLLGKVSNSVVFLDEFEKTMDGKANENDRDGISKQETLLSVLDGNSAVQNNLFILTVNNSNKINENMISRPGRIKYHYRFITASPETIRSYCNDNLERKELTEEIVETLVATRFVSMDIISSLIEELNIFPEVSVQEAMSYLNIDSGHSDLTFKVTCLFREKEYVISSESHNVPLANPRQRINFGTNTDIKYDEYDTLYLSFNAEINMTKFKIPLIGFTDITEFIRIEESGYGSEVKIIRAEVKETRSAVN